MHDAQLPESVRGCVSGSIDLLQRAATPFGFVASPDDVHYGSVWARDAAISGLGALTTDDSDLHSTVRATLETLIERRSDLGQIPDAVWFDGPTGRADYWDWGEAGCTDATAWMPVLLDAYVTSTGDVAFGERCWPAVHDALTWLRYQDANNMGLIDSPRAGDWMDSSLARSGKVLHVNVLLAWALQAADRLAARLDRSVSWPASDVVDRINLLFWPEVDAEYSDLWAHVPSNRSAGFRHKASVAGHRAAVREDRSHYLASVEFGVYVDRCDTLANAIAVLADVASSARADRIVDYLGAHVAVPFPSRTWVQPIDFDDREGLLGVAADATQDPRWRNAPGRYHNGAVWPFVGGFHAAAVARCGRRDEAIFLLDRLATANAQGDGFHEWIGLDGVVGGPSGQAWNAGAYLLAVAELKRQLALGVSI